MSVTLKTYGSDRRLELGAAEAIRQPAYGSTWQTIRIGIQYAFDGVQSSIAGNPLLLAGICHGSTQVMIDRTAGHVLAGCKNPGTIVSSTTGGVWLYDQSVPQGCVYYRKGATANMLTNGGNGSCYHSNNTAIRTGRFIEFAKGVSTWQVTQAVEGSATPTDLPDVDFQNIMELASLTSITSVRSTYSYESWAITAPDETTYGVFDNIFMFWDRTTNKPSFNIRHRKIN